MTGHKGSEIQDSSTNPNDKHPAGDSEAEEVNFAEWVQHDGDYVVEEGKNDTGADGNTDQNDEDEAESGLEDAECETDYEYDMSDSSDNEPEGSPVPQSSVLAPGEKERRRVREDSAGSDCSSTARRPEAKRIRTASNKGEGRPGPLDHDYYLDFYDHVEFADRGEEPSFPTVRIDIKDEPHIIHGMTDTIEYEFHCPNTDCDFIYRTFNLEWGQHTIHRAHNSHIKKPEYKLNRTNGCKFASFPGRQVWCKYRVDKEKKGESSRDCVTRPQQADGEPGEQDFDWEDHLTTEEPWQYNPKRSSQDGKSRIIVLYCPFGADNSALPMEPEAPHSRLHKFQGRSHKFSGRHWKATLTKHIRDDHEHITLEELKSLLPTRPGRKRLPPSRPPPQRVFRCPYGKQQPEQKTCNHWFVGEERHYLRFYHVKIHHLGVDPSAPYQDDTRNPRPIFAALNGGALWEESGLLEGSNIIDRRFSQWELTDGEERKSKDMQQLDDLEGTAWTAPENS